MSAEQRFHYPPADEEAAIYPFPGATGATEPLQDDTPEPGEAASEPELWSRFKAFAANPNQPRFDFEKTDEPAAAEHREWRRTSYQEPLSPIDFADLKQADMLGLSLVIHRFAARGGHETRLRLVNVPFAAAENTAQDGAETPVQDNTDDASDQPKAPVIPILSVPESSIARYISDFYKRYGTDLHPKDKVRQQQIRDFLSAQSITYARIPVYEDDPKNAIARHDMYPEFKLAEDLMEQFDLLGHDRAADATEVVLASYGYRFLHFASMAVRESVEDRRPRQIRRIDESTIPENYQAEREQRPRQ